MQLVENLSTYKKVCKSACVSRAQNRNNATATLYQKCACTWAAEQNQDQNVRYAVRDTAFGVGKGYTDRVCE